jgi:hypothetical protein
MRIRLHLASLFALLFSGVFLLFGQLKSLPSDTEPEAGFLSPSKYTNPFFGFSLPLPDHTDLSEIPISMKEGGNERLLLGFRAPVKELVAFTITAKQVSSMGEVRKAAAEPLSTKKRKTLIAGKPFWRTESITKMTASQMQTITLTTAIKGYALQFEIISFNSQFASELEQDVDRLVFFDPEKTKEMAGNDGKPYRPGLSQFFTPKPVTNVADGSVSGNIYSNDELGFRYELPRGWVLNNNAHVWGNDLAAQIEHLAPRCTKTLLYVTRYPEDPPTAELNPTIILAALDPTRTPEVTYPAAPSDRQRVQQVAKQTVDYFGKTKMAPTSRPSVRAFNNAGRTMIEISQSFTTTAVGQSTPLKVLCSVLLMQAGDYWVTWVFAGGNELQLKDLRETKIFFDKPVAAQAEKR